MLGVSTAWDPVASRHIDTLGGPSAFSYSVGVPEEVSFAAQYPARTCPCQRFDAVLADRSA